MLYVTSYVQTYLEALDIFFNWHREVLKLERGTDLGEKMFSGRGNDTVYVI